MASLRYERGTLSTILGTELNGLANNTGVISSTIFDNTLSSNLYFWANLQVIITLSTAPTQPISVDIYIIPSFDGINFADVSTSFTANNLIAASIPVRSVLTTQRLITGDIILPPHYFKLFVLNRTGSALTASGHSISMMPIRQQI